MTTESHSFSAKVSNAPRQTARDFDRWLSSEDRSLWSADLNAKATRALLTLKTLEQPNASKSDALIAESKKDLADFAAAYAEMRAQ